MLRVGGAEVHLFGFRRGQVEPHDVDGIPATELGQTFDGRLKHRALQVVRQALRCGFWRERLEGIDILLARNLEMLLIARQANSACASSSRLAYECLDIHPAMVSRGLVGPGLRAVERLLLRSCNTLVVSSPAFVRSYFEPFQRVRLPVILLENKALSLGDGHPAQTPTGQRDRPGPPWRIGWYGVIRAQKALDILTVIAQCCPGLVEFVIRGRPALIDFRDFHGQVQRTPGLTFLGPYRTADLDAMYADVHFCWAFDYFDEGRNSSWLLPNRLYEGGQFGAVPIALRKTETGRWLAERGIGVLVDDPITDVPEFLQSLTEAQYFALRDAAQGIPREDVIVDQAGCRALIQALAGESGRW